jgi:hypothetical protein
VRKYTFLKQKTSFGGVGQFGSFDCAFLCVDLCGGRHKQMCQIRMANRLWRLKIKNALWLKI